MRIPLAPAGRREMVVLTLVFGTLAVGGFAVVGLGHASGLILGVPALALWLGGLAFFRDPERPTPAEPDIMVAPADGKVVDIATVDHHEEVGGAATRIGIFLSVFDVHINRSPCCGVVRKVQYQAGQFLDARDRQAGQRNESNTIVIEPDDSSIGLVVVRQIAGLIARRIVCSVRVGDRVETGQRIGLIKFGSRTELIVSAKSRYAPAVAIGDRARGARTILARRSAAHPPMSKEN